MLRIGLTGGIGSGKSTITNYFAKLGIPIIDADKITHEIMISSQVVLKKIVAHFGKKVLNRENSLNRSQLRRLIFKYPQERRWLENLLHPLIISIMKNKLEKINSPYCILVIPLLAKARHLINFLDRILVVDIPKFLQIQRTKIRDHLSDKQIKLIFESQTSREDQLAIANDVIVNDKTLSALYEAVLQLHTQYLKFSK
ncbi:dephospho-CoA kinase [Coxiella endosymbiont of Rhipicephalus microplus]|uniref:dephospho-CoA kinase n=1 Tax=Coxiella endosymbiont of Rhipicephalus microplus TaxID=1656186 RepID=UPI000C805AB8|nr:dephospho-CoA kinase [Coxiella endosymbiont of Rhipicephalus microplus]PMB55048.1 Dephospho-CoA kinase [Coxiella-like endosymbiont]